MNPNPNPNNSFICDVKAVVAAFNQEKALVEAFSVIVQLRRLIVYSTNPEQFARTLQGFARDLHAGSSATVRWTACLCCDSAGPKLDPALGQPS